LVAAQEAPASGAAKAPSSGIVRKGFYISAGWGRGQQRFEEDLGGGSSQAFTEGGAAAALRIGGMLSPKVALSLNIFGFVPENGGGKDGTGGLFATATFFPRKAGGFLLQGAKQDGLTERFGTLGVAIGFY